MPNSQEGLPRKWGSGGQMTVSTRCAQVLTGINPQRFFGSFLIAQKGTRPAGRNPRGETKFRTKFFAKLSFKKAERYLK